MSALIYIPAGLPTPEPEILIAKVQNSIDAGENTIIATCAGGKGYVCSFNIYSSRGIGSGCQSRTREGLVLLKGTWIHVTTPATIEPRSYSQKILKNRWEIKKHQYKGVDTGQAAYSSYTGLSRDHDLEGRLAGLSLHKLLATTETLTDWFEVLARETQLKRVILFNGRNNRYRPILRLARQLGIEAEVIECFGQVAENVFTFRNNLAQDFDLLQEYTEESWRTFQGDKGRWRRKRAFRPPRSISGGHRPEPKADCCRMGPRGQRAGGPARSLPRWWRPRR